MTMIDVIPREFFDGVAVTLDGGLLAALDEAPAGPWLAEMVEAVDRSRLTAFELPTYLRMCSRLQARVAAQLAAGVADLASRPDAVGGTWPRPKAN